jgi:hypothetical protein
MSAGIALERMEQQASTIVARAKSLKIRDQQSYEMAAAHLLAIATLRREIEAHHGPVKQAAHRTWQQAIAAEKRMLGPVSQAEHILKTSISEYDAEQRRLEKEKRTKAEAEAQRKAEEQLEREIEEAEAEGADEKEIGALISSPLVVAPPRIEPTFQQAKGVSVSANWRGEVVSLEALVKAVAAGNASINLVQANEPAINQLARPTRGTLPVPGVRFYSQSTVRASKQ